MTRNLPKVLNPSEEIVRRIAMDVGKQVVAHIDHAYPEMLRAVKSPKNTRLSIRNATFNAIMQAVREADEGKTERAIDRNAKHRRTMRRLQRAAGVYSE